MTIAVFQRWAFVRAVATMLLLSGCSHEAVKPTYPKIDTSRLDEGLGRLWSPRDQELLLRDAGQDRVYFGYDQADLSEDARSRLRQQAEVLLQHPLWSLTVEGHTDDRGTREYNLALSERRARNVRDYLVALGVAPDRLDIVGYGKERPAALGKSVATLALNRRGVTVVQCPLPSWRTC